MNESPAFTEVKAALIARFTGKVKVLKNSVIFLNENKERFAGVNRNDVWMSVLKQEGQYHYFHASTKDDAILGIDKLGYSEQSQLANDIFNHFQNAK